MSAPPCTPPCPVCLECLTPHPCGRGLHNVCAPCYAKLNEKEPGQCPLCRAPYLPSKLSRPAVEEVQSRKRRAYMELQCPTSPPEKKRASLSEFLHCEATIRDQVRVRVFERTERNLLDDVLQEEVDRVLEHSLERDVDPHKASFRIKTQGGVQGGAAPRQVHYVSQMNLKTFHFFTKMKFIFTILSILFFPIFCFKEIKPKLCINCKYFITDNNTGKYGRCILFPIEQEKRYFLVNGDIVENKNDYQFCAIAREMENKCGKEGKMYKKKYTKKGI